MNNLERLYLEFGQSPWLDNLRRRWVVEGELERWVSQGIRGLTSNPSIFQKAISSSEDYDEQFGDLIGSGMGVSSAYWELVTADISGAMAALKPVYNESGGSDGFVSVEVDPGLALDTEATLAAARALHQNICRAARPNLMVKIPGTPEGLPAIRQMIAEGRSVNVTLIFSVDRYQQVAQAYIAGLQDRLAADPQADLSTTSSVASFFISRIDTEVDARLSLLVDQSNAQAAQLMGRAAVSSGQCAYAAFGEIFSGPGWEALAKNGARVQRPLWASTSAKNPSYPDTLYVDELIAPMTVNTMPDDTLDAFVDHGTLARKGDADPAGAAEALERLAEVGVDLADVCEVLESQGVAAFEKSFVELLETLETKAAGLS